LEEKNVVESNQTKFVNTVSRMEKKTTRKETRDARYKNSSAGIPANVRKQYRFTPLLVSHFLLAGPRRSG
jgi:hypothetical protein